MPENRRLSNDESLKEVIDPASPLFNIHPACPQGTEDTNKLMFNDA
jgi:hypothetical protein